MYPFFQVLRKKNCKKIPKADGNEPDQNSFSNLSAVPCSQDKILYLMW
jgi:hypothetical protein